MDIRTQRTRKGRGMRLDAEYCRISRDRRGAAEGVETQQAENAEAAGELGVTIAESYLDNDLSAFSGVDRPHGLRLFSTTKGGFYNLGKASGRKELRDDTSEAEYESEHRGERVTIARKRQARQGLYGGGVRPFGWGVDSGRVRSVCVNPKAAAMERRYEDRPVLDMTRHNQAEA